jgi:hypothetical protein
VAPTMNRRSLVLAGTVAAALAVATCASSAPSAPSISFAVAVAVAVPDDVRALATQTWSRFVEAFPARTACLAPVELAVAWQLDDRAAYDRNRRVVTIRIPGTAPNLEATMLHEFAHHLDFTCPQTRQLRAAFLASQSFPPGASWTHGATWETTPAEQYAEAVAQVVLGEPPAHRLVALTNQALEVIRAWGRGG